MLALAINSGLVAFPTGYNLAWSATGIHLWRPKCPESYISLGCLATSTKDPPSLTAMVCLHHSLGIEAQLGQCLVVKQQEANQDPGDIGHLAADPGANVWCVDNAAATFTVTTAEEGTNPKGALSSYECLYFCCDLVVSRTLVNMHNASIFISCSDSDMATCGGLPW